VGGVLGGFVWGGVWGGFLGGGGLFGWGGWVLVRLFGVVGGGWWWGFVFFLGCGGGGVLGGSGGLWGGGFFGVLGGGGFLWVWGWGRGGLVGGLLNHRSTGAFFPSPSFYDSVSSVPLLSGRFSLGCGLFEYDVKRFPAKPGRFASRLSLLFVPTASEGSPVPLE